MSNSHRSWITALLLCVCIGCADDEISLEIHSPSQCCRIGDESCIENGCPLADLQSVEVLLEQTDGTIFDVACVSIPEGICNYEDLQGLALLKGLGRGSGLELRLTGRTGELCSEALRFQCDSFGNNVVSLKGDMLIIPAWCDCPFE